MTYLCKRKQYITAKIRKAVEKIKYKPLKFYRYERNEKKPAERDHEPRLAVYQEKWLQPLRGFESSLGEH